MSGNKKDNFKWTDELVLEFSKSSTLGQYGIYDGVKSINDKLNKFKMVKSKLLSENTAQVSLSDIKKNGGILSAEYNIEKLKGKIPYILKEGKYVPALNHELKKAEYLLPLQAKHINNLLNAKLEIDKEIQNIKKSGIKYERDELISKSVLSTHSKLTCSRMLKMQGIEKHGMLSDVASIPVSKWKTVSGIGKKTMKEIEEYLLLHGFTLRK